MKGLSRPKGFTLLELLVAVGLLALLVFTLSLIFSQGLKALRVGYNRAEMMASARTAMDQMIREIPSAIADGTASYPFLGFAKDSPGKLRGTDSVGPELYFVGQVSGAGKGNVAEMGYWLARTSSADTPPRELKRFYVADDATAGFELYTLPAYAANFSTPSGGTNSNLLSENVKELEFIYHYKDATGWKTTDNWDSTADLVPNVDAEGNAKNPDGLPNGVEVRLILIDKLQKESPQTLNAFITLET